MAGERKKYKPNKKKRTNPILDLKLTIMIIVSVVVVTIIGAVVYFKGMSSVGYGFKKPFVMSALMEKNTGEGDTQAADTQQNNGSDKSDIENASAGNAELASASNATDGDATASDTDADSYTICYDDVDPAEYAGRMPRPLETEDLEEFSARSAYYSYGGKKALSTPYPYVEAGEDYYKDTLFLGDSRIEGLHDYGNIEGAAFCYKDGLSVYNIFSSNLNWGDLGSGTLEQLVNQKSFKKIYIMLGVNELGKGFDYEYAAKYKELLDFLQENQKDAVITVMSVMYVTKAYSDGSVVFNNDNINSRNYLVAEYVDGISVLYLDINPCIVDDYGALNAEYTYDGIHLSADKYIIWVDFLKQHALQDAMWE